MTSYPQNSNIKEDGKKKIEEIDINSLIEVEDFELPPDRWIDDLEDELLKKKKVRINSKYSEKRHIP